MLFCEILTPFPFSRSPLLSLSSYILSHLSMIAGSWVGGLIDIHLHLYPHITSLIDHRSFPYSANFMATVSRGGAIELSCLLFHDIHLAPRTFLIYNSTPDSSNSQSSLYSGSQILQSIYRCLPSPPPLRPSQCTLIMVLLVDFLIRQV
jgi:hypothetical protein